MDYQLIRSSRKTLAIEVRGTQVIVRAPNRYAQKKIDDFVAEHEEWLKAKIAKNTEKAEPLSKSVIYRKRKSVISQRKLASIFLKEQQCLRQLLACPMGQLPFDANGLNGAVAQTKGI